jgi:hypothetical protein
MAIVSGINGVVDPIVPGDGTQNITGNLNVSGSITGGSIVTAPAAHTLGGASHTADTLANLNAKVSDDDVAGLGTSQQFTKNQRGAVVTLTYASPIAIDASLGNNFEVTLTDTTTELDNPTNLVKGMTWLVHVIQDGSGGRALTFDTFYDWGDEGAPTISALGIGESAILSFYAMTTTKIAATAIMGFTP